MTPYHVPVSMHSRQDLSSVLLMRMWTCVYSGNAIQFFLQTFKPTATIGDGNCMFYHLVQNLSVVIRLLTYTVIKHRTAMIDAISHILYFNGNNEQVLTDTVHKAIHLGVWGRDLHVSTPIFSCHTFHQSEKFVPVRHSRPTPFSM